MRISTVRGPFAAPSTLSGGRAMTLRDSDFTRAAIALAIFLPTSLAHGETISSKDLEAAKDSAEKVKSAYEFGKDPSTEKVLDAAITAMTIGYPPAGAALGRHEGHDVHARIFRQAGHGGRGLEAARRATAGSRVPPGLPGIAGAPDPQPAVQGPEPRPRSRTAAAAPRARATCSN
ncbi:MAG: hypothetical protein M5U09_28330 [Gammaproteobacteria bacterium]|nr:hypothetical protein [Gammaproteobacteria bacterium]